MTETHDEYTLHKVYDSLATQGIVGDQAWGIVNAMQNEGVLFRERSFIEKYHTKPTTIEAVQFTGGAVQAGKIIEWVLGHGGTAAWDEAYDAWESDDGSEGHSGAPERVRIETLEGTMYAEVSAWVARGIEGEFYPIKDTVFQKKYQLEDC